MIDKDGVALARIGHAEFMHRIDVELTESGELVFQQGLANPSQARTVKVQQGVPVATDGRSPSRGSPWWGSGSWTSRTRPTDQDTPDGARKPYPQRRHHRLRP